MSHLEYIDDGLALGAWSAPVQITGEDGAAGGTGPAGTRGSVHVTGTTTTAY